MNALVLVIFFGVIKHSDHSNLREKAFILAHSARLEPIMLGKESEAAGPFTLPAKGKSNAVLR